MKGIGDLIGINERQFLNNVENSYTSKVDKKKVNVSYKGLIVAIVISVVVTCFLTTKITNKIENYSLVMLYNLSDQLVNYGFAVNEIIINGNEHVNSDDIRKLVDARSIFFVSLSELRNKIISSHQWIKDVSVRRVLPSTLEIAIQEYSPFANWYHDRKNALIDDLGHVIIDDCNIRDDLTSIYGDKALSHLDFIRKIINDNSIVSGMVSSVTYVDNSWWDIVLSSGLNIKLPKEEAYVVWCNLLDMYKASSEFLVWKTIDMRIPGKVDIVK
ncbi:FtsQ-type POTRA domain-containing protein [Ehrlichia ruminantium]|uniref:FtsQ-type POTRA domain-containing protein n=1 Tax=Ehrlichia ruminantium TaxID=779 RepID=A0AAE6Q9P3_EHRRU|nr:FtsQ-type POTRA domain-containing protein [Ehrlichia ruminantium]QGR03924.1 FtsQ-type POTRA domain-containing protein [Ehrlichia ruminantium]QGR04846.1 FtsQ-type POTRA domain-containing protein [Ehrlichia ruminantium]